MGSLFQIRDFWESKFPGEEFSPSAITIGNLDNTGTATLVGLGSFQGKLRVLQPSHERGTMHPEDVLYERDLKEPILQLTVGAFEVVIDHEISRNLIAVLHPQRLCFLSLERHEEVIQPEFATMNDGRSSFVFFNCVTYFETHLDRPAYNFVVGRFLRSGHDMVCVQSIDGMLTIVDHNKVLFRRSIPPDQFLLPSCLAYNATSDALLTCNASHFLLSYSFRTLVNSKGSEPQADREEGIDHSVGNSTQLSPSWAYNLGDDAIAIEVCRLSRGLSSSADGDIIVLCPYALHILDLAGCPRLTRKLDVEALALAVYPLRNTGVFNVLVSSANGSISVYSDVSLDWSASLSAGGASYLAVGNLCGVEGMILCLTNDNELSINYLGTDPADGTIQPMESKAATYAEMVDELREVQLKIKHIQHEQKSSFKEKDREAMSSESPSSSAASPLSAGPKDEELLETAYSLNMGLDVATLSLQLRLREEVTSVSSLDEVMVLLSTTAPLQVDPPRLELDQLSRGRPQTVTASVFARQGYDNCVLPSSLEVSVIILYRPHSHAETTQQSLTCVMPLMLIARATKPIKEQAFVIQLNTNRSPPPRLDQDLFNDFSISGPLSASVVSIRYMNGADATVLVSKNAARFKVQGSSLEGLWLLTAELCRRLRKLYGEDLVIEIPDEVPLKSFLGVIDTHIHIRREVLEAQENLGKAAQFFRAVQRRLLTSFRDRNPTAATKAMETLFHTSYGELQQGTEALSTAKARLVQASAMLNCCLRLLHCLLREKYHVSSRHPELVDVLAATMQCTITDEAHIGWEEFADVALEQCLGVKATKRSNIKALEPLLSSTTLGKSLRMLVERLAS